MTQKLLLFFVVVFLSSCKNESSPKAEPEPLGSVTWSADIAPIIFKNCTPCHRPGESGAFDLLKYRDAFRKGKLIKFVTQTKYMPPWPADPNYSHFVEERSLKETDIELIKIWVDSGMPRGDSTSEPKAPAYYRGSYYRKPDLVIKSQQPVEIKGNGNDVFLIMKYPYEIPRDTIIDFVEFVPHHRKLVHHVNGHLVNYDHSRTFNYFSGEVIHTDTRAQLVEVYSGMHVPYTDKKEPHFPTLTPNVVYYLPGYLPPAYPAELGGYRMKRNGMFLLNNIHYGPSNSDLLDSSYINVFFREQPIQRVITETQLGTFGISPIEPEFTIPAYEVKTFHTQSLLPKTISLLSVNPHMHLIGKSFWAFALRPNGDTIPLIKINKWDFRWQYYYTFTHPVKLEMGSTIHVYGTYDNTLKNPNNPFHPPRSITQGNGVESMKTSEEMFQFIFTYVNYKEGDEKMDLGNRP